MAVVVLHSACGDVRVSEGGAVSVKVGSHRAPDGDGTWPVMNDRTRTVSNETARELKHLHCKL